MMISDDTQRLVCFLYMNGYHDKEICMTQHIDRRRLEAVKLQLAFDLKKAGILMED